MQLQDIAYREMSEQGAKHVTFAFCDIDNLGHFKLNNSLAITKSSIFQYIIANLNSLYKNIVSSEFCFAGAPETYAFSSATTSLGTCPFAPLHNFAGLETKSTCCPLYQIT